MLGEFATDTDKEAYRERLDSSPLGEQYLNLWGGVFDGTLGLSYENPETPQPVMDVLLAHLPATVELAISGMLVAFLIAFPLGIAAALRPYTWVDQGSGF